MPTAVAFYQHRHGRTCRRIAGDSLLAMNSLLEKEGMAGKVQVIYIDPPYGIRYDSDFQPLVNKRNVKDGQDENSTSKSQEIRELIIFSERLGPGHEPNRIRNSF